MAVDVDGDSPVNIFDLVMEENNFSKRAVTIIPVALANKLARTIYQNQCKNS